MPSEKYIKFENQILHYYLFENSSNRTYYVMLHGWGLESKVWIDIGKYIYDISSSNVILLDLPGFGQSSKLKHKYSFYAYCEMIEKIINKVCNTKAEIILIGHSFGGKISSVVASRKQLNIKKIILIDSAAFKDNSFKTQIIKLFSTIMPKQIKEISIVKKITQKFRTSDYNEINDENIKFLFLSTIETDISEILKKIQTKIDIIWGENDEITPLSQGIKIQQLVNAKNLFIIKNAKHLPFLENKDEFLKALNQIL
ncbi:MAG: alpha/beta hydrolase [Candidatus Dojkabacteria bacterium]|nr:alpha/beta hydrolase [Candidatus Dojkabacteria bacterium]